MKSTVSLSQTCYNLIQHCVSKLEVINAVPNLESVCGFEPQYLLEDCSWFNEMLFSCSDNTFLHMVSSLSHLIYSGIKFTRTETLGYTKP
jgi:hypothetical protein